MGGLWAWSLPSADSLQEGWMAEAVMDRQRFLTDATEAVKIGNRELLELLLCEIRQDPGCLFRLPNSDYAYILIDLICKHCHSSSVEDGDVSDDDDNDGGLVLAGEITTSNAGTTKLLVNDLFCNLVRIIVQCSRAASSSSVPYPLLPHNLPCHTPLHRVCETDNDFQMIKTVFEAHAPRDPRELVQAQNHNGCTPLHFAAGERSCPYSSLKLMLDTCCRKRQDESFADCYIHYLCPRDNDGETPLHWAVGEGISPRRLRLFLLDSLEPLDVIDNEGLRPLDYLATSEGTEGETQSDWDYMLSLMRCVESGEDCRQPLHSILKSPYFCSPRALSMALKWHLSDETLLERNREGLMPIHILCSRKCWRMVPSQVSFIDRLLEDRDDSYGQVSSDGRLALHFACESDQEFALLKHVWKKVPDSHSIVDPKTLLYPFMLAATGNNSELDCIYFLLRQDPALIRPSSQK